MCIAVRKYYGGFVSLAGIAAGIPFLPPLLHLFMPDTSAFAAYLYPPLGDIEQIAIAAHRFTSNHHFCSVQLATELAGTTRRILPSTLALAFAACICLLIALLRALCKARSDPES